MHRLSLWRVGTLVKMLELRIVIDRTAYRFRKHLEMADKYGPHPHGHNV